MTVTEFLILLAFFAILFAFYYGYRVYKHSIIPRYKNDLGMEMYTLHKPEFKTEELGAYYGDFIKGIRPYGFDDEGAITWLNFHGRGETILNPCMVAEFAIICHADLLLESSDEKLIWFKNQLEWLMNHATEIDDDKIIWHYLYTVEGETPPFGSAISQGMATSALLRGYQYYGDERYLDYAKKSFNLMDTDVANGGFRFTTDKFKLWYEEDNHHHHILNGHIYALFAVHDLYRVTKEPYYAECFELGLQSVKDRIRNYDLGFNTKYDDATEDLANNSYHYTHITLFTILFLITDDPFFEDRYKKFRRYHEEFIYKMRSFIYIIVLTFKRKFR